MLMSYALDGFPQEYVPTIFENYQKTVEVCTCVISQNIKRFRVVLAVSRFRYHRLLHININISSNRRSKANLSN